MPVCPPKTEAEREAGRWEFVVGKALKDYVTIMMVARGLCRDEARKIVLQEIKEKTNELSRLMGFEQ